MGWFGRRHQPLTPASARSRVFEHWDDLNDLCQRRFPRSENLAHQGLLYAIDRLEQDGWKRVCAWQGNSGFRTFLLTLAARLLTDFSRERFGHVRPPQWLERKTDPVWRKAYKLLIVDQYERREAVGILQAAEPDRERGFLDRVAAEVIAGCPSRPRFGEGNLALESVAEPVDPEATADAGARPSEAEIELVLLEYLECRESPATADPRLQQIRERLLPHVRLSEQDRALLRLRCLEGMKMGAVARRLGLSGDPYKRYHRLIRELGAACRSAGLL